MRCDRCGLSPWVHRLGDFPAPVLRCPYPISALGDWDPVIGWVGRFGHPDSGYPISSFEPRVAIEIIEAIEGKPFESLGETTELELDLRTA